MTKYYEKSKVEEKVSSIPGEVKECLKERLYGISLVGHDSSVHVQGRIAEEFYGVAKENSRRRYCTFLSIGQEQFFGPDKSHHPLGFAQFAGGELRDGVRHAISIDPDYLLINDVHDKGVMDECTKAAKCGLSTMALLNASTVMGVISKISDFYEGDNESIGGVFGQAKLIIAEKKVPSIDGDAIPVYEYLIIPYESGIEIEKSDNPRQLLESLCDRDLVSTNIMLDCLLRDGLISEEIHFKFSAEN